MLVNRGARRRVNPTHHAPAIVGLSHIGGRLTSGVVDRIVLDIRALREIGEIGWRFPILFAEIYINATPHIHATVRHSVVINKIDWVSASHSAD